MSDVNTTEVEALLNIAEKCTGHSGKLGALQNWAITQLMNINEQLRVEAIHAATQERIKAAEAGGQTGNTELASEEDEPEAEEVEEPVEEETTLQRNERLRRELAARQAAQATTADEARR